MPRIRDVLGFRDGLAASSTSGRQLSYATDSASRFGSTQPGRAKWQVYPFGLFVMLIPNAINHALLYLLATDGWGIGRYLT